MPISADYEYSLYFPIIAQDDEKRVIICNTYRFSLRKYSRKQDKKKP